MVAPMTSSIPTTPAAPTTGLGKAARASRTAECAASEPCFSDVLKAEGSKAAQVEEDAAEALAGTLGVAAQTPVQNAAGGEPGQAPSPTGPVTSLPHPPTFWEGTLVEIEPASQGMEAVQPTQDLAASQPPRNSHPGSASPVQPVDPSPTQITGIPSTLPATSNPVNPGQPQLKQPESDSLYRPGSTPVEARQPTAYPASPQAASSNSSDLQRGPVMYASEGERLQPENPPAAEPSGQSLPGRSDPGQVSESEREEPHQAPGRELWVDRAAVTGAAEVGDHGNQATQPTAPAEQAQTMQVHGAVGDSIAPKKAGVAPRVASNPPLEAQPVGNDDQQGDKAASTEPVSGQSFQSNGPQAPEPAQPGPILSTGPSTRVATTRVDMSSRAAPHRETPEAPPASPAKTTTAEVTGSQQELSGGKPITSPQPGMNGQERARSTKATVSPEGRPEPGEPVRQGASQAGQPVAPPEEPPGPPPETPQAAGTANSPGAPAGGRESLEPVQAPTVEAPVDGSRPAQPTPSDEPNRPPAETPPPVEPIAPQSTQRLSPRQVSLPGEHGNDPRPNEVAAQLGSPIATLVHSRRPALRVQLNPENLGHIELRLTSTAHGVGVILIPEQSSTGQLLESQLSHLRQALSDAGVQLNSLNVGSGSSQTPDGSQWQAPANPQRNFSTRPPIKEDLSNVAHSPVTRHETSQIDYRV